MRDSGGEEGELRRTDGYGGKTLPTAMEAKRAVSTSEVETSRASSSQSHNLAMTALFVPSWVDSGDLPYQVADGHGGETRGFDIRRRDQAREQLHGTPARHLGAPCVTIAGECV